MNEQELRIGNFVILKYTGNIRHVYQISSAQEISIGCGADDFEAIPLCDPILEKHRTAHFFVLENGHHFKIDENVLLRIVKQQFNSNVWIPVLICEDNEIKLPPVEHLHQLQNLVFALSGKELEINLSV